MSTSSQSSVDVGLLDEGSGEHGRDGGVGINCGYGRGGSGGGDGDRGGGGGGGDRGGGSGGGDAVLVKTIVDGVNENECDWVGS